MARETGAVTMDCSAPKQGRALKIISVGAWTTRNCFRPSASLAVVLGTVGQGSWRLADCRDERTRLWNVTMIQGTNKDIRFKARLDYRNTWQCYGEAD